MSELVYTVPDEAIVFNDWSPIFHETQTGALETLISSDVGPWL
jgi:hypothetical protein